MPIFVFTSNIAGQESWTIGEPFGWIDWCDERRFGILESKCPGNNIAYREDNRAFREVRRSIGQDNLIQEHLPLSSLACDCKGFLWWTVIDSTVNIVSLSSTYWLCNKVRLENSIEIQPQIGRWSGAGSGRIGCRSEGNYQRAPKYYNMNIISSFVFIVVAII